MSILVIRAGGLGDCLLTLPVIDQITKHHSPAQVSVLGNRMMCEVAGLAGWINTCHSIDDIRFARLFADTPFSDELVSFFSNYTHVYWFSSIAEPDRFERRIRNTGVTNCHILDPRPPEHYTGHIVTHLMKILPFDRADSLDDSALLELISTVEPGENNHGLLIHPGSGSVTKNWPLERFCTVADEFQGDSTFMLGPAEIERGYAASLDTGRYRVVSPTSIHALAACIAGAGLFLGNDSGSAHLAGILGVSSVVLFGPTDPRQWRPLGTGCITLRSPDRTLTGISVGQVLNALDTLAGNHV